MDTGFPLEIVRKQRNLEHEHFYHDHGLAVREKLNLLLVKHCAAIKTSVGILGAHLQGVAEGGTASAQALEDAVALAHQLKGSSGTAGFQAIYVAAAALNDNLRTVGKCSGERQPQMQEAMQLFARLDDAAREAEPQTSSLYFVAP